MDKKDPPIEPQEYLSGLKVVDIGDLRVARGLSRRPHSACKHSNLVFDTHERRIWCKDCEHDVESFDAFAGLVEQYSRAVDNLNRRSEAVVAAEKHALRSLAAKAVDEAWRSRNMVPACPHCGQGLFPEDFKHGVLRRLSRKYAEQMARFRKGKKDV